MTRWRWNEPAGLSRRACRALRFFCALHRLGPAGYVGTIAPVGAVAAAIARATCERMGRSLFYLAAGELIAAGYLTCGTFRGGRPRRIGADAWARDPIPVYTTTAKARAIWGPKGADDPDSYSSSPVQKLDGMDRKNPIETIEIDETGDLDTIDRPSSTGARAESPEATIVELRAATSGGPASVSGDPSPGQAAPARQADRTQRDEAQAPCQARGHRTASQQGTRPTTWPIALRAILGTLALILGPRGRAGRVTLDRATHEASGRAPTAIAWDYWISRWPSMTREERMSAARRELLPALSEPPSEPSPLARGPGARPGPRSGREDLARVLGLEIGSPGCPTIHDRASVHTAASPQPTAADTDRNLRNLAASVFADDPGWLARARRLCGLDDGGGP